MHRRSFSQAAAGLLLAAAAPGFRPAAAAAQEVPPAALPAPRLDDPIERLSRYLRLLADDPHSLDALTGAGKAALEVGDASAAVGFYARAQEAAPADGHVKAGLAAALVQLEQPKDALRLFDKAKDLGVPEAEFAADRGLAYDLRGDGRRAQADYRLALARGGANDETVRRLALSLAMSGDRAGALAALDPLLRRQDRAAWRASTFVLAITGDVPAADARVRLLMTPPQAQSMQPFLARLAALHPAEQAAAVHFGHFPATGQAAGPGRGTQLAAAAPTRAPPADRALVPAGTALGTPPAAAAGASARPAFTDVFAQPAAADARATRRRPGQADEAGVRGAGPGALAMAAPPVPVGAAPAPRPAGVAAPAPALAARPAAGAATQSTPMDVGIAVRPPLAAMAIAGTARPDATLSSAGAGAAVSRAAAPVPVPTAIAALPGTPPAGTRVAAAEVDARATAAGGVSAPPGALPVDAGFVEDRPSGMPSLAPAAAAPMAMAAPAAAGGTPAVVSIAPAALAAPAAPAIPASASGSAEPAAPAAAAPLPVAPARTAAAGVPETLPRSAYGPPAPPVSALSTPAAPEAVAPAVAAVARAAAAPLPAPATASEDARPAAADAPERPAAAARAAAPAAAPPRARGAVQLADAGTRIHSAPPVETQDAIEPRVRGGRGKPPVAAAPPAGDEVAAAPTRGRGARGRRAEAEASVADDATATTTKAADAKAAKAKAAADKAKAAKEAAADKAKAAKDADAKAKAAKAAEAKAKAADEKKQARKEPERYWVQVAGGANKHDLPKAWDKARAAHPQELAGKTPHTTPLRFTNRLLVGPFKSEDEAQAFVNRTAKAGWTTFAFTSPSGQKVETLPAK